MKAFLASLVLTIAITALSAFILGNVDMSAKQVFTSPAGNVRL